MPVRLPKSLSARGRGVAVPTVDDVAYFNGFANHTDGGPLGANVHKYLVFPASKVTIGGSAFALTSDVVEGDGPGDAILIEPGIYSLLARVWNHDKAVGLDFDTTAWHKLFGNTNVVSSPVGTEINVQAFMIVDEPGYIAIGITNKGATPLTAYDVNFAAIRVSPLA